MILKARNFSFKFGSCEIKLKHIESGNHHILEVCAAAPVFLAFFFLSLQLSFHKLFHSNLESLTFELA